MWSGEFGRTPFREGRTAKSNVLGRDHFPDAWSVALAGAKVAGGQVIGESTPDGMDVKDRPVKAADLFATALEAIGIDYSSENHMGDRPIPIVDDGFPIKELLG